jgi:hypothetical protein
MSTLVAKPKKAKLLNTKLLPIAALLLLVLALLFMATPLLRVNSGFQRVGGFNPSTNGQGLQTFPGGQNGFQRQGVPGLDGQGFQRQGGSGLGGLGFSLRRFGLGGGVGRPGAGLLGGITGTIFYAIALLVSLAAALGMFLVKRWGKVLGIVMAVIYLLLSLVSLLPMLLITFSRGLNALSLGLSILHLALAIAVIVLASIPAKALAAPVMADTPPAASS